MWTVMGMETVAEANIMTTIKDPCALEARSSHVPSRPCRSGAASVLLRLYRNNARVRQTYCRDNTVDLECYTTL